MPRQSIPPYCNACGAPLPRAAAGRCPFCRVAFAQALAFVQAAPRALRLDGFVARAGLALARSSGHGPNART
ncbi:hypothetical protein [Pararhodobacter zhoushanensis]|uniref:hypothetical protein n=1 Tax=Pararhodobacter zhoushanensis TaxID=2479545 RepID=UPI000F8D5AA5|nr:hypothetical protein [Pararhodobacter zhoushanensis]